jgi:hypothetical protein
VANQSAPRQCEGGCRKCGTDGNAGQEGNGGKDLSAGRGPDAALLGELIPYRHPEWSPDDGRLDEAILEHAICRVSRR